MNIKKLSLLSLFLFLNACSSKYMQEEKPNELSCIQIVDRNGLSETISSQNRIEKYAQTDFLAPQPYKQVLRIYKKNLQEKAPSIITTYHPNGLIWQYLEVVDARAFGKYQEWFSNGQLKIEAYVMGGEANLDPSAQAHWIFDKTCKAWDEKGNLLSEIIYNKGSLEGDAKYYYSTGKIRQIIPYRQGLIHGEMFSYHPNGEKAQLTNYVLGYKDGKTFGYAQNGKPLFYETYKQGSLLHAKYLNLHGQVLNTISDGFGFKVIYQKDLLHKLIEYKNANPEGKVSVFDQGKLIQVFHQMDGQKHGKEILYYPFRENQEDLDQPKLSLYWENNEIHGQVTTYYRNGQPQSQKTFTRNKKNGSSCAWYENGDLMFVEDYENNLLVKGTYYKIHQKEPISHITAGTGIATIYDKEGSFLRKTKYVKGMPQEE